MVVYAQSVLPALTAAMRELGQVRHR
jgi:hypothetical protein